MAKNTKNSLKNDVIYSIYVRNYGKNGTFKDVQDDLNRIKNLGVDIIWFMPIHPIGVKNKKGSLGCPYAIKNYREVNPEYGTLEDFIKLVDEIHNYGMKCIIDVVYNHTAPDSILVTSNPEYYYKKEDGNFGNRVGEWTDIIDLDYKNKDLWNCQIDTLKYWTSLGVDGFRCDVASLIPIDFWIKAREEVSKVKKDTIWLAESVHSSFVKYIRSEGLVAHSDCELYEAFDICYDYDVNEEYCNYFEGKGTLKSYIDKLSLQEAIYPDNYIKLRFLENHDQERAMKKIKDVNLLKIWTMFMYFQKGTVLLYNGQESLEENTPSLFDIDKIDLNNENKELVELFNKLYKIKKAEIVREGFYSIDIIEDTEVVVAVYNHKGKQLVGIFNFGDKEEEIDLKDVPNGEYIELITEDKVEVIFGKLKVGKRGYIFS